MKHTTLILFAIITILILQTSCSKEPPVTDVTDFRQYSVSPGDVVLTASPDSVAADGKMYAAITISVGQNVLLYHKSVTFDIAQAGTFADGSSRIKKDLDNNGSATIYAVSGTDGIGIVKATLDSIVRTASVRFFSSDPFSVAVTRDNVDADNVSNAEITIVTHRGNIAPANALITLATTSGTLNSTAQVQPAANDTTKIYLHNNHPGLADVTATYAGTVHHVQVTFKPAFPDLLVIDPDSTTFSPIPANKTRITARLLRNIGTPSDGQFVNFRDSTAVGSSIGVFVNNTLSASSLTTVDYYLQDTSYHGYLYIIGYIVKGANDTITGRKRILIH